MPTAMSPERPTKLARPGWPEIVAGPVALAVVAVGVALLLGRLDLGPVTYGLAFAALAGVAPLVGFVAAILLRIRSLGDFGVRRVSGRWLVIGVVGSTLIFALVHGVNEVFPAALVVGLIAGEIFRRSGSVWPGVLVHAGVNLPTVPALVLAGAA